MKSPRFSKSQNDHSNKNIFLTKNILIGMFESTNLNQKRKEAEITQEYTISILVYLTGIMGHGKP